MVTQEQLHGGSLSCVQKQSKGIAICFKRLCYRGSHCSLVFKGLLRIPACHIAMLLWVLVPPLPIKAVKSNPSTWVLTTHMKSGRCPCDNHFHMSGWQPCDCLYSCFPRTNELPRSKNMVAPFIIKFEKHIISLTHVSKLCLLKKKLFILKSEGPAVWPVG